MHHGYRYQEILAASERVTWQVEDLIGGARRLDFSKPFLPESLARVEPLAFLPPAERLLVNQIRGHGYLYMFGLVEEFILPFVLDHVRPHLDADDHRTRALLRFASDEAKHIHLFKRFREEFQAGFRTPCEVIGPPAAVAQAVLAHDPLSVAIMVLHIEWMTQRHYLDSVRHDEDLDPQFVSLLKHHWMEEAQHAKLDTLMVEAIAEGRSAQSIVEAVEGYLQIGGMFDAALKQQVEFDLDAFIRATGRQLEPLTAAETKAFIEVQHQACRWTFIGTGMTHPRVLQTLGHLEPKARELVERVAPQFC